MEEEKKEEQVQEQVEENKTATQPSNPTKEGYVFLEWNTLPKIMPDSDITVSALHLKKPETTLLDTILTEQEKAEGISVKSDITVADENENIELALANKYSKYTASIIINIDLSKGKDESFTPITETENLLTFTVDIPAEIQDKAEYIVLREHNGTVDALTTSKNADGEYIEVKDNTIIIHAKKFSAYQLLAKDADPTPSRRGGGGGSSSYTVKFETNGAPAIKSVSVSRNNVITAPTAPVKDGFVFDGWYTDKEFKTKFDFATKITKSMTLYAKWTEKAKTSIILTIGKKDADINGKTVANDVAPKIVNDRTMLPIRFIAEALGAKVLRSGDACTVSGCGGALFDRPETTIDCHESGSTLRFLIPLAALGHTISCPNCRQYGCPSFYSIPSWFYVAYVTALRRAP